VSAYQADLVYTLGAPGRPSAVELFRSVLKATCPESLVDTALALAEKRAASQASERSRTASVVSVGGQHPATSALDPTSSVGPPLHSPGPLPSSIHGTPAAPLRPSRIPAPIGRWCYLPSYKARRDYQELASAFKSLFVDIS
jgi:hypothetical protein